MRPTDPLHVLEAAAIAVWRNNGRLASTIKVYLWWVHRFGGLLVSSDTGGQSLTRRDVDAFAASYAERRGIPSSRAKQQARIALKSWSGALRLAGYTVPEWEAEPPVPPLSPLLAEYIEFRRKHAGVSAATIRTDVATVSAFLDKLQDLKRLTGEIRVADVDDFVTVLARRVSTRTVARACSTLRCFLRFLHFRGYLIYDVAGSVAAPRLVLADRPPRALPWEDVVRLLAAIDTRSRTGRRDRALLLLMATYGMGAAEALHLELSDIDWRAGTIHMIRPKTGVECLLPLLPAVAEVVVAYLRDGRPRHTTTRALFVGAVAPYGPMSASAARYAVRRYGRRAGLSAAVLGGHVLRHSHACRQIELGALPKVVSDILGHRDPTSTSNYFRGATTRLRALALPVPE